jgi:1-deoxy-D-xylulose-5-phosphate synthase
MGLLDFQERFPKRFFDVGIAEQHAVTAAAGMAMGGLKPVVAMYSTFFSRAFDQAHLDVGLLNLPVVFAFKSAGITGDDGPSHHGLLDMALCLAIPNMTIFAPATAEEIPGMLSTALSMSTPTAIRFPKTLPKPFDGLVGEGLHARQVTRGDGSLCVLAVGKMAPNAYKALEFIGEESLKVTLYDVRVLPPDPAMIDDALSHERVVTIEDGTRHGGAGTLMVSALRNRAQELAQPFPTTRILGVPRVFLEHDHPDSLLTELGLDAEGLSGAFTASARPTSRNFHECCPNHPTPTICKVRVTEGHGTLKSVTYEIEKSKEQWRQELSPERYAVLREAAPNAPSRVRCCT